MDDDDDDDNVMPLNAPHPIDRPSVPSLQRVSLLPSRGQRVILLTT